MNRRIFFIVSGLVGSLLTYAQDSAKQQAPLTINGYSEMYYLYDLNRPLNNTRPGFVYSHNRTNEVTLNLAFIKANYSAEGIRGNIALAIGTYMNANLAAEPGVLKNIYEANAGIKLSKRSDTWIDAGIMASHIGIETAVGKDNWTLTRSIVADNSPYYEAGVKFNHTSNNGKWYFAALYLNGWQRINRANGNSTPAFGTQLTYKPSTNVTLNYSTFTGNDKPDSVRLMRYFHNLYGIFQLNKKFGVTIGFDYGFEQKTKGSNNFNNWYSPLIMLRLTPDDKNTFAFRGEYYKDENGVIINTSTVNGFDIYGWSVNYDRNILPNAALRVELRNLYSKDAIFLKRDMTLVSYSTFVAAALTFGF
jgi:hypothetical protein